MKAVQVVARGRAEFVDVPEPKVQAGYVLVRTSHLSLCGSDIHMLHYAADSAYPFPPGTTGHEMVGVVEAVGDRVGNQPSAPVQVGDRVLALAPGHKAMCECFSAPFEHVVRLPGGVPMERLLQAQQLGTVLYASRRLPKVAGKDVCVIGQGSAGLWFNFHLRRLGAKRIVALDIEPARLERSTAFGASDIINNRQLDPIAALKAKFDGQLADIVVEAAGEIDAINLAIDLVKPFGEILYFGVPRGQTFPINFHQFFHKCCRATTIVGASSEPNLPSMKTALDLVANGEADADAIITHRVEFSDVLDAYEMHRTRADGAVKIVIAMPGAISQ